MIIGNSVFTLNHHQVCLLMSSYCTWLHGALSFSESRRHAVTSALRVSCAFTAPAVSQQTSPDFRGQNVAASSFSLYSTLEQILRMKSWACWNQWAKSCSLHFSQDFVVELFISEWADEKVLSSLRAFFGAQTM